MKKTLIIQVDDSRYDDLMKSIPKEDYVDIIEGKVLGEPQSYNSKLFFKAILYNKAKEYLDRYNFKKTNSGYTFLMDAIQTVAGNPEFPYQITKSLYPDIADKYGTATHSVERNIRTAINSAFNEKTTSMFRHDFDYEFGPITNGTFITCVSTRIWKEIYQSALE